MNIILATLASLIVSCDEDYADNDKNKSENKNKSVNYDVDRPPAITE
jgi:hypothetical protein